MHKIILADDHAIVRAGLKNLLAQQSDFIVVAEATDGEHLLDLLLQYECDVVIMDLSMPKKDGIETLKIIKEKHPNLKTIVLTMQNNELHFRHAMAAGAAAYMLKEDAYDQLVLAIRLIIRDKSFVSPSMAQVIAQGAARAADVAEISSPELLTRREREVIRIIANGGANKNIATVLQISIRTVEAHRRNIMHKLGLKNTAALVKYSLAHNLA